MKMPPIAIFALVAAVLIAIAVYGHQAAKQRRAALQAWADRAGYAYDPGRERVDLPFGALRRGSNRYLKDRFTTVLQGAVPGLEAARVELFEYHYEVDTGVGDDRSRTDYYLTCVLLDAQIPFGKVRVEPEGMFDRLVQSMGFEDIDFDHPEFSKAFKVTSPEPRQAHDLLGPELMDLLLASRPFELETQDQAMLLWRRGKPNLERFAEADQFARSVLASLPRLLVNMERERRGLPPEIQAGAAALDE